MTETTRLVQEFLNEAYVSITDARLCLLRKEGDPDHFAHKGQSQIRHALYELEYCDREIARLTEQNASLCKVYMAAVTLLCAAEGSSLGPERQAALRELDRLTTEHAAMNLMRRMPPPEAAEEEEGTHAQTS